MKNRDALMKARRILIANLKAHNMPVRGEVSQLIEGYPMRHTIEVLENLIVLFPPVDEEV